MKVSVTSVDSTGLQWTLTGLGLDSDKWLAVQWTGLGIVPANLAWQNRHWNPLESTGVHMKYVGRVKTSICTSSWLHFGGSDIHQAKHKSGCIFSCIFAPHPDVLSPALSHFIWAHLVSLWIFQEHLAQHLAMP